MAREGSLHGSEPFRYVDLAEAQARRVLPEHIAAYVSAGAGDGLAAAEAVAAWNRFRLVPRVLMDVTHVSVRTTVLGAECAAPLGVAPTTLQRAVHPEGEVAMARGAAAAGVPLVVSSNAGSTFADIGEVAGRWWVQAYISSNRAAAGTVVERAVAAGASAVVLTVDTPVVGTKRGERRFWEEVDPAWLRVNHDEPDRVPGLEKARDLGPQDIAWLRDTFEVPVVVKGVLHPADARRCVDAGAAAVWVSNHGGRQLDRAVSTAEALAGVAEEVAGDVEVYVDGGLRRGEHLLTALALGARAVFLGRPPVHALAVDGELGVRRLLEELGLELLEALRLAGVTSVDEVPRDLVANPCTTTQSGSARPG